MNWTKADLEKLQKSKLIDLSKGKIKKHINPSKKENNSTGLTIVLKNGKISVEKEAIKKILWVFHREGIIPDYVEEHQFHDVRQFRFDWAIPEWKLAIEYEGIFSKKSGHTTISGYTKDCRKYNLAQLEGWKVLRYTAKNYKEISNDLKIFKEK